MIPNAPTVLYLNHLPPSLWVFFVFVSLLPLSSSPSFIKAAFASFSISNFTIKAASLISVVINQSMDPPQVSLLDWIDYSDFSLETLDTIEILWEFFTHCQTEFPGILSLHKESKIPEDFLLSVNNHKRVFFISEVSFANTIELNSQICKFWEDVDTGVSLYFDSHKIGNRRRLSSSTSEGKFYFQEFCIDTIIPAERCSLCTDDERRTTSLFFKPQSYYLCELVKFPPWGPTTSNMTIATRLDKPHLPFDILFDICTWMSADAVVRCTSVCKLWYKFIRTNYLCLRRISIDRILAPASYYLYEAQKFKFIVLVKPTFGIHTTPTAYMASYHRDANTFHISEELLWLPPISNGLGLQVIGSVSGLVCVVGSQGFDLYDPVTIFNPLTRTSLHLPPFRRRYMNYASCVGGFGFVPEIKRYRLVRVVKPAKDHQQAMYTFTVGVNKQWVHNGFISKFFGPFLANGVLVRSQLFFKDASGKIAAYNLSTEMFVVLTSPPIDMREEDGVRSSSLCNHRDNLATVVLDFIKNTTSIWLNKSTRTAAATSTVWEPFLQFATCFTSCNYSLISFSSIDILWLVDGKKVVSHETVEEGVQEELLGYSQGLITEMVGHCFTYVDPESCDIFKSL